MFRIQKEDIKMVYLLMMDQVLLFQLLEKDYDGEITEKNIEIATI